LYIFFNKIIALILYIQLGEELFWKDNKKIEHKLQVIINHAIRFVLSTFRTTPIPALQVESNIPPVSVIIHQMQSRLAYRLLNFPYHHSFLSLFPPDIPRSLATPHSYQTTLFPEIGNKIIKAYVNTHLPLTEFFHTYAYPYNPFVNTTLRN
jgi:hypothetical protein